MLIYIEYFTKLFEILCGTLENLILCYLLILSVTHKYANNYYNARERIVCNSFHSILILSKTRTFIIIFIYIVCDLFKKINFSLHYFITS